MIRFIFREEAILNDHVEIHLAVERANQTGRWLKTLNRPMLFKLDEWDALRAMMLHGATWFQEGEATIKIEQHDRVHAYMEGENGRQES